MHVDWADGPVAGCRTRTSSPRLHGADAPMPTLGRPSPEPSSSTCSSTSAATHDGHQLPRSPTSATEGHSLVGPEVADHRAETDRRELGLTPDAVTVHVVRAAGPFATGSSTGRSGGEDLPDHGQAGQADVAPGRRRPVGHAPATSQGARSPAGGRCWRSTVAQRGRLPARARRELITAKGRRPADRAGQPRLLETVFELTLRLRRDRADAGRDRRPVQHQGACATSTHPTYTPPGRADDRPIARAMKQDPYEFRAAHLQRPGPRPSWTPSPTRRRPGGRSMPSGTAQGIAIHKGVQGCQRVPGRDRLPPAPDPAGHP